MELPSRPKNDRYTRPGEYLEVEQRLRRHAANADIPTLVAYAFDYRTRLGPFLFLDRSLQIMRYTPTAVPDTYAVET